MSGIPELQTDGKLLHVVEGWLRIEKAERRRLAAEPAKPAPKFTAPFMPSKHMAFFR